jgi:hypothetical protein
MAKPYNEWKQTPVPDPDTHWTDTEIWWVEALESLDWDKDKKSLLQLLRSDIEITPLVREYLADLIERRCSIRSNSNRRLPAYHHGLTLQNWHIRATLWEVDKMMEADPLLSLDDAIKQQAAKNNLDEEVLHACKSGKHRSFREATKGKKAL